LGENVNIGRSVVARPSPASAVRHVITKDELQACRKWQLLGDFVPAPAGDFGDSVNIASQPAGAV
jgi:hypothetical protein